MATEKKKSHRQPRPAVRRPFGAAFEVAFGGLTSVLQDGGMEGVSPIDVMRDKRLAEIARRWEAAGEEKGDDHLPTRMRRKMERRAKIEAQRRALGLPV